MKACASTRSRSCSRPMVNGVCVTLISSWRDIVDQQQSSGWNWFGHKAPFANKAVSLLVLIVQRLIAAFLWKSRTFQRRVEVKMLQLRRLVARARITGLMLRKLPQAGRRDAGLISCVRSLPGPAKRKKFAASAGHQSHFGGIQACSNAAQVCAMYIQRHRRREIVRMSPYTHPPKRRLCQLHCRIPVSMDRDTSRAWLAPRVSSVSAASAPQVPGRPG